METTNEILDSASHDCPLVTQTYSTGVAKGIHVPVSPTRLGKDCGTNLEGKLCQDLPLGSHVICFAPGKYSAGPPPPPLPHSQWGGCAQTGQLSETGLFKASEGQVHVLPL